MAPIRYMMNQRQIISIAKHQASTKQQGNIARNERKKNSRKASNEVTESKHQMRWQSQNSSVLQRKLEVDHRRLSDEIVSGVATFITTHAKLPSMLQHRTPTNTTLQPTIQQSPTIWQFTDYQRRKKRNSKNYIRSLENIPHKVQRRSKPNWCYITVVQSEP